MCVSDLLAKLVFGLSVTLKHDIIPIVAGVAMMVLMWFSCRRVLP